MDIVCSFLFLYPSYVRMPTCPSSALICATSFMNHVFDGSVVSGEIDGVFLFVSLSFPLFPSFPACPYILVMTPLLIHHTPPFSPEAMMPCICHSHYHSFFLSPVLITSSPDLCSLFWHLILNFVSLLMVSFAFYLSHLHSSPLFS